MHVLLEHDETQWKVLEINELSKEYRVVNPKTKENRTIYMAHTRQTIGMRMADSRARQAERMNLVNSIGVKK